MLYRTGIKLTLALIVALIAVVARAGGGDPRLPQAIRKRSEVPGRNGLDGLQCLEFASRSERT